MTLYVVDASVGSAWTLHTQRTTAADALLKTPDATFTAPFMFIYESRNLLLKAERSKRTSTEVSDVALEFLASVVAVQPPPEEEQLLSCWTIARSAQLSFYDACYVDLAMRLNAPLATRDKAQIRVAPHLGVTIYNAL